MPKIRAATVAEHRQLQRAALLDAARTLLTEGGMEAMTFPALAARAGLARSSVYEYFRSRAAVIEELCAVDFPLWAAEIEAGMAACDTPHAKVEAYVRGQLALAADPRHRAVVAISALELDEAARDRIRTAHHSLVDLVVQALQEIGHEQPRVAAALLQGVVEAAVRQVERAGAEGAGSVSDSAVSMVLHGLCPAHQLGADETAPTVTAT
ncbi:AcrR family transcriptional regulator [Kitasatospora gansuensis]|uniref:AcrR family transcriptional regulator n=1 Tax=Kitasatospora gansuensis TaxID=258050 RepID=A0A7W7WHL2_9ACTN|nr:TetR family transcriptional regulator [Kitasatospora gansuensis]MBB4946679.1 AcrR family transcriptional regulator [Kitasatospora gansuensis]